MEVGTRVIAIISADNKQVFTLGEGEYVGDKIPSGTLFERMNQANPCIKLDQGGYAWGFETWWGPAEKVKAEIYPGREVTQVTPPPQHEPKDPD